MPVQDSGSNYSFFKKKIFEKLPKSKFDLSYINSFNANLMTLYPFYVQHTLPNEDYKIEIEALIKGINPPSVPIASRLRAFFHFYWISYDSLWKGWQVFMSKGHSGNYVGKVPEIILNKSANDQGFLGRNTLSDFLGLNINTVPNLTSSDIPSGFSALPFMAYQRIYRDYYMYHIFHSGADKNEYIWFPFYDGDFRLNTVADNLYLSRDDSLTADGSSWNPLYIGLGTLRRRPWIQDYFTSARPWPQRGTAATLDFQQDFDFSGASVGIGTSGNMYPLSVHGYEASATKGQKFTTLGVYSEAGALNNPPAKFDSYTTSPASTAGLLIGSLSTGQGTLKGTDSAITGSYPLKVISDGSQVFNVALTMADLRNLNANQRILEKMARTDGTYLEFSQTFFNESPRGAKDHRPIYIGGAYQSIKISEVLQTGGTSASQIGGAEVVTAQGTATGHANAYESGYIGKFHSDDFGIIMGIMSIMPDVYYSQGLSRDNTRLYQEQFYMPERAGLSPQAILNREIYYDPDRSGADPTINTNIDVFAYQDIWDDMRYRQNEVHGKVADPKDESWSPFIQSRFFSALPEFNEEFATAPAPTDWLTSADEDPFLIQIANRVTAIRPLPYMAQPAKMFDTRG